VPEYSPRFRTAVLLCGAGTAGVYQAGVLKALHEAGIKIDLVAGHGPGAANALGAAIDGGARLWDPSGPWSSASLARAYRWRGALRVFWAGLALAAIALLSPLLVMLVAAAF
jgi:predicted acylesterase/phospholipase RssA